jgi:D-3-phosphoglycerate dehydrogenase
VLIRERAPIRAPLLDGFDRLRIISQVGGFPHVDLDACTRRSVIMSSRMAGGPSYATAELNWGLMIAAMRRVPQAALKAGKWQVSPLVGVGLRGKTLGVYGYGRIGAVVAGSGRAFGMEVLVWGRESTIGKARTDGYKIAASKDALFAESDVVSIHLQLNNATRGIVTATDLSRMKPTALFVNTSRAGLVVPGALEGALRSGPPGMAAVDVFDDEPPVGGNHPLLAMDNVVCTPHLGYVERNGLEGMFGIIFDQILAYADGKPINAANPEVLDKKPEGSR